MSAKKPACETPSTSHSGGATRPTENKRQKKNADAGDKAIDESPNNDVQKPSRRPILHTATSRFDELKGTDHFVDKTQLIEVFLNDPSPVVLVTAPAAFGKSVNLDMLRQFLDMKVFKKGTYLGKPIPRTERYDLLYPDENLMMFYDDSLYIRQCHCAGASHVGDLCDSRKFFDQHHGKHPVVSVDFHSVEGDCYEEVLQAFRDVIVEVFDEHRYLLECDDVWKTETGFEDRNLFNNYLHPKPASETEMEIDVGNALTFLTEYLHEHFKRKVCVLIDGYDAPINNIIFKGSVDIEQVINLLNYLLLNLLKNSNHVDHAMLVGIFQYFPANSLEEKGIIEKYLFLKGNRDYDSRYVPFFGLTTNEVEDLLGKFVQEFWGGKQEVDLNEMRNHFNGYISAGKRYNMYPMKLVMRALAAKKLDLYCERTGAIVNSSKQALSVPIVRFEIEKLIQGKIVKCLVPHALSSRDLLQLRDMILNCDSQKIRAITAADSYLSLLLQTGYLSYAKVSTQTTDLFKIRIPNEIARYELSAMLEEHYGPDFCAHAQNAISILNRFPRELSGDNADDLVRELIPSLQDVFTLIPENATTGGTATETSDTDPYQNLLFDVLCKTRFQTCCEVGSNRRPFIAFSLNDFALIFKIKHKNPSGCEGLIERCVRERYVSMIKTRLSLPSLKCYIMGLHIDENNKLTIAYKDAEEQGRGRSIHL